MENQKISIKNLSPEERKQLLEDLRQEEESKKKEQRENRKAYEELKNMAINESFGLLASVSKALLEVKESVFDNFKEVLDLKQMAYDLTDEQMAKQESHTFTSTDGKRSIIIGSNVVDRWDETVDVGINKVKEYLKKLAANEESARLVSYISDLMKPNKDGHLKANRILDLSRKADEHGDKELIEAVSLIREAYRPVKTSTYIKVKYKDEKGKEQFLPLSMSALP